MSRMTQTPEQAEAEKARRLMAAESAAASAMYNGATASEVRARVEIGIAEVLASPFYKAQQERRAAAHR